MPQKYTRQFRTILRLAERVMGVLGRPPVATPEGFEEVFVEHGWEAKDLLGMRTSRFKRSVEEGGADLKRRRRNYVLGRRLSSLKRVPAAV